MDPYSQIQDDTVIARQINVQPELDRFVHESLLGMTLVRTADGQAKWERLDEDFVPPVNQKGVRGILLLLNGVITTANKLAYKDESQVMKDMFYFHCVLMDHFYLNGSEWGLDDGDVTALKEAVVRLAWDIASASINGFTAMNIRSQYTMSEMATENRIKNPKNKILQTLGFGGRT